MFVATIPNRNSPPAILLRYSYRESGKVKTKTLLNLSSWEKHKVLAFKKLLKGDNDILLGSPSQGQNFGTLFGLFQLARECGIVKALGSSQNALLSLFLVLARIAHQGSRLSSVSWSKGQAYQEVLGINQGFDENALYKALDWLEEHQEEIEERLYKTYVSKHEKPPALVLYDVTSSYFEGQDNELSAYGYNRDKKKGKKQIVIGLLTSETGEPLAVRVFKGNTTDCSTVVEQIEILKNKLGIEQVVFVGDKGMLKSKGKEALDEESWHYITSIGKREIEKLLKEGAIQYGLFDEDVEEVFHQGKRYILRLNKSLREMLNHKREDRLNTLKQKLEQRNEYTKSHPRARLELGQARLEELAKKYRLDKFVKIVINEPERELEIQLDEEAKKKSFMLDGCYVLETKVAKDLLDKQQIDERYHDLSKVERNFRTLKTEQLEVRPVYLRKATRTRAHVFVSMLSLKISRHLESKLKSGYGVGRSGKYRMGIEECLGHLGKINLLEYEVEGEKIVRLPRLNQEQARMMEVLGIKMPKNVGREKAS